LSVSLNDRPNKVTVSGDSVTVTTGSGVQGPQGATGATGAGGTVAYFGNFFSTETQPNVSVSAANTFTLNSTVDSNGVSIVDGSKITFAAGSDGTYDLQFSVQFDKTDSGTDEVDVWLSKNGTNEAWSNTKLSLVGNNAKVVAAWNFQLNDVVGGDFFQLHWWSPDADMRALAEAAGTSPSRPAVPSIIVTVAQVTYTQLGPTGPTGATGPQGPQGDPGAQGDPGVAVQGTAPANTSILWADTSEPGDAVVPTGGTTGQALAKASNSDYDTTWLSVLPVSVGTSLGTTGTIDLNMATLDGTFQAIALSGNPTFTTSNRVAGRSVTVKLSAGGSARTLMFPSWVFVGAAAPSTLASGKVAVFTVTFFDTTDAGAVCAYAAQP
jgi:hypothetical protein